MTIADLNAKVARKPWTEQDDTIIRLNASQGVKALAAQLERPESQIRTRAKKLGVSTRREGEKRGRPVKVNN